MDSSLPSPEQFREQFEQVVPLIRQEWPAVDEAALGETGGDLERVVELVAARTEHTRVLTRRQLAELCGVASGNGSTSGGLDRLLRDVESRARRALGEVQADLLPKAEGKVRDNLLTSLLVALGLGFVVGFIARGSGHGR